jgi:hypothetical protein
MLKRVALLGTIAALSAASPSHSVAQDWDGGGWRGGWGGGVTVTVTPGPRPYPYPYYRRPAVCCRPIPRPAPVVCCSYGSYGYYGGSYYRPWRRPLYYYGDSYAPYGYHYDAGYTDAGYGYDDGP